MMLELRTMSLQIGPYTLANPWILAPMAGVSEMPFRILARELGAGAAPTELISAKGLLYGSERTQKYLRHDPEREAPFWVQLFGGDAASMVEGGRVAVAAGAKILDINMGCPVRKVTKGGAGSSLLCQPEVAAGLVRAMVRELNVPITVKIRAGWDAHSLNFVEMAERLADAGCAAIAMHARTRAQGYSGQADWSLIARLVEASRVPIIGNGDAFDAESARRLRRETGCAAVMIGRGALGNPWVFEQLVKEHWAPPTPQERWQLIERHLMSHLGHAPDELRGIRRFRPHLMWYARGLYAATHFRKEVMQLEELAPLLNCCERFFGHTETHRVDEEIEFEVGNALG